MRSILLMKAIAGTAVAFHLTVDGDRLALHTTDAAQHQHRTIENAQRPLHFDGEVDVAGSVDQVDVVAVPLHAGRGTGDRDPTFFFQFHVVHGRAIAATTDFFDLVNSAGVEQDPLAERRFARVDVGTDTDVSDFLQIHNFHLTDAHDL